MKKIDHSVQSDPERGDQAKEKRVPPYPEPPAPRFFALFHSADGSARLIHGSPFLYIGRD